MPAGAGVAAASSWDACAGTPPGSETIGSPSAASARGQLHMKIMRRNNIMFSRCFREIRVRDGLRDGDVLFMETPPVEFYLPVSRQPVPGSWLIRGGAFERI